ncbi:hypothetical protein PENTCL1PPCAC_10823, partial [Pristionchus entomophagus]
IIHSSPPHCERFSCSGAPTRIRAESFVARFKSGKPRHIVRNVTPRLSHRYVRVLFQEGRTQILHALASSLEQPSPDLAAHSGVRSIKSSVDRLLISDRSKIAKESAPSIVGYHEMDTAKGDSR